MANELRNGVNGSPQVIPVGEELPPMEPFAAANSSRRTCENDMSLPPTKKRAAGERFVVLNAFVDCTLAELSRAEIAVWLVLYRDTRDGTAETCYDDLARRAGCDRRSVGRAVGRLKALGLVHVVAQGGLRQGASRYRVTGLAKDG